MPAIASGRILVTGASGYIAAWIIKALLDHGFSVSGTVRSHSKGEQVKGAFRAYGDRVGYVIVEDVSKEGAFDEAVKGADAIVHTASPFNMNTEDPDELIVPAVNGTVGILESAKRFGDAVKRIVLLSSCAAIASPGTEPRVADETCWNDEAIQNVFANGKEALGMDKYRASKTLAERAAWTFFEKHSTEIAWDLVAVNPPIVIGPWLYTAGSPDDLNESLRYYYSIVVKGKMSREVLVNAGTSWVDVRDLGEAHALALLKPAAGGERIIVAMRPFKWQEMVSTAHRLEPSKIPPGNETYNPSTAKHLVHYKVDKERRILGMEFRSLEETSRDILYQFMYNKWL
ncbi:NAD-P-binding protein [Trametes meyenii]|nr:NAD-P-binding protein [Trametes meyenii]